MAKSADTRRPSGKDSPRQFVLGLSIAEFGLLLIGLGAWDALNADMRVLMYVSGSMCLLSGICLIWLDAIKLGTANNKPPSTVNGLYLGRFKLNNYTFDAYERDASGGRREFRLVSNPSVSSAQEAAFVRYMVNEGHIENMWPHMSKQIEEDADWAFAE
jgi:hypothetical protein